MTQSVGVFQTEAKRCGALICKLELTAVQLSHTQKIQQHFVRTWRIIWAQSRIRH